MSVTAVFSSSEALPDYFLQGFAFSGTDLVLGDVGYEKFRKDRKSTIQPGDDGSFLVLNKVGRDYEVGSDYGAYSPIYYFKSKDYWAFSRSFNDLAERLWAKKIPLSLDVAATAIKRMPKTFGEQPGTFQTPVSEIRLLPRNKILRIKKKFFGQELQIVERPSLAFESDQSQTYEERMFEYVSTWVGRHSSMLLSDIKITIDVTGGTDSRASLALCLKAAELTDTNLNSRVYFNSKLTAEKDLDIATKIAENFNFSIRNPDLKFFPYLNGENAYQSWLSGTLHSYWPFYGSNIQRRDDHIWLGGGGGEAHRYNDGIGTPKRFQNFLDTGAGIIDHDETTRHYLKRMNEDLATLSDDPMQPKTPIINYFRNFRERFHHGRRSIACNAITPLSGRQLDFASRTFGAEEMHAHQAHVDIAGYCAPDLTSMPLESRYEHYAKFGTRSLDRALNANTVDLQGKVFAGETKKRVPSQDTEGAIFFLKQEFFERCEAAVEAGIISNLERNEAIEVLDTQATSMNFKSPRGARPVVASIWAGRIAKWTQ